MSSRRTKIRVPSRLGYSDETSESLLRTVGEAIDTICKGESEKLSFEHHYRIVYTLVLRGKAPEVYECVQTHIATVLDIWVKEWGRVSDVKDKNIESYSIWMTMWKRECEYFKLLSDVMIYMDKVYCKPEKKLETYDLALHVFRDHVIKPLFDYIYQILIESVNESRHDQYANDNCVNIWRDSVDLMEKLDDEKDNYFATHFEPIFLFETKKYYESELNGKNLPPVQLLEHMKKLKQFEYALDCRFLNADSTAKVTNVLDKVLLWNQNFLEAAPSLIRLAIDEGNVDLMKELADLSSEERYAINILDCIKKCISDDANAIPIDTGSRKKAQVATQWTTSLIALYDKYHDFLKQLDFRHLTFQRDGSGEVQINIKLLNDVFSNYLNGQGKQAIELLTTYLDVFLKMTQARREVDRIKKDLEASVKLFKLFAEKDVFINTFKLQMSRRLLQHRSSTDVERWMVKRLKEEMGTFFTSKLDGMLRDIGTSSELLRLFRNSLDEAQWPKDLDFRPQILTMTSWPFQPPTNSDFELQLPTELEQLKLDFESFYTRKYTERTLQWAHNLGYIEIGFQFDASYHELSMPIPIGIVFLMFEKYDELTIEMIEEQTNIPSQELHKHLLSLTIAPKSRILKKKPMSRTISSTDKFSINYSFSAPARKVKVQTITGILPPSRSDSAVDLVQDTLKRERLSEINAAVVRIMKAGQRLTHTELMNKVTLELESRFPLTGSTFKKSLNYLLEKEYIQRDPEDISIYHYIS